MSTGVWTPESEREDYQLDQEILQKMIAFGATGEWSTIDQLFTPDEQALHRKMMTLPPAQWQHAGENFSSNDLALLIQVLAMAEMQLPGWEAGADSPIIWINRLLKKRGEPLNRDMLLWLRQHSTNRFIPNGAL